MTNMTNKTEPKALVPSVFIHCSICGESHEVNKNELSNYFNMNICPRCKQVILYARTLMENQGD